MRQVKRYCIGRMLLRMSWNSRNMFNIIQFEQHGFHKKNNMNTYQFQYRCRGHIRNYHMGDLTLKDFRKEFLANGECVYKTISAIEQRLDNLVFRSMLAPSVYMARKLISQDCFYVNDEPCRWPGYKVLPGTVVSVKPAYKNSIAKFIDHPFARLWAHIPNYLEVNFATMEFTLVKKPVFSEIPSPYPKTMAQHCASYFTRLW